MRLALSIIAYLTVITFSLAACLQRSISPTPPLFTPGPTRVDALVYFLSEGRFAIGIEPYEEPVQRSYPAGINLPKAVLYSYFEGPTEEERERGLEAITSGFTGFRRFQVEDGTAHVYLDGNCASLGAAYNISQLLMVNLLQFQEIKAVKVYDEHDQTGDPSARGSSIPVCLEP